MASAFDATRLILKALHPDLTPAAWETDRDQTGADWDDLVVRSIVLGLAPQLHRRLVEWRVTVPPRPLAKLAVAYQGQGRRNAAIFTQLDEVLEACHTHGLRPIALKGVHLAAAVYPDPALRPMKDIDLLFEPAELPEVEKVLNTLGYRGKHKSADLGPGVTKHTSTYRRAAEQAATPNPYLSADAGRTIEPHTSLEESWFGLKVDVTPGVRQRAVEAQLGRRVCRVLARDDLLLHLSAHFCFHLIMGAPSMVQLADLLVVTVAGGIDWPVFVERARQRQASPYALAALRLAQRLLAAPVPDAALDELARATPGSLRSRIAQLGLADILRRTQQKPLTTVMQRIRRGFADRAETARWAADWRGHWRVWKTALHVGRTDTGRILLGK